MLLHAQGAWDISTPLLSEALSQRWFHAAASHLASMHWPAALRGMYGPVLSRH